LSDPVLVIELHVMGCHYVGHVLGGSRTIDRLPSPAGYRRLWLRTENQDLSTVESNRTSRFRTDSVMGNESSDFSERSVGNRKKSFEDRSAASVQLVILVHDVVGA